MAREAAIARMLRQLAGVVGISIMARCARVMKGEPVRGMHVGMGRESGHDGDDERSQKGESPSDPERELPQISHCSAGIGDFERAGHRVDLRHVRPLTNVPDKKTRCRLAVRVPSVEIRRDMPRLFTALEVPADVAREFELYRGGMPGARWVEPENYHLTLRFLGDIDHATARDVAPALAQSSRQAPIRITLDGLGSFGGDRPRAIFARVAPDPDLTRLQARQEKLMRDAGLEPESRKYTPHVTLARLRGVRASDVAAYLARAGHVQRLSFTAERFVLMSSRNSVGGGPYLVEAAYPLAPRPSQAGILPA